MVEGADATLRGLSAPMLTKQKGVLRWAWSFCGNVLPGLLQEPGQTADELLLKFTRRTQPTSDATPVFSAR